MDIGIIGSGNVGGTLGRRFIDAGHAVTFGVRDPTKPRETLAGVSARVAHIGELRYQPLVLLATPWSAAIPAVLALNPLPGQIIVDCTNPIHGRLDGLSPGGTDSGGEMVQRSVPHARVVKAFNTCGFEVMHDPRFARGCAVMPVCGDDDAARVVVMELAGVIGFDAVDLGLLRNARYLEPMAMVWIMRALTLGAGRRWAFGLVS